MYLTNDNADERRCPTCGKTAEARDAGGVIVLWCSPCQTEVNDR